MRNPFTWTILVETQTRYLTFPSRIARYPVSDAELKHHIADVIEAEKIDLCNTDINSLAFVAASIDSSVPSFLEYLNPLEFWPIKDEGLNPEFRSRYRTTNAKVKGGEK